MPDTKSSRKAPRSKGVNKLQTRRTAAAGQTPDKQKRKRIDWEAHHALITTSFLKFFDDNQRIPTGNELAKLTKLSRKTCVQHTAGKQLEVFLAPLRVLGQRVMVSIANKAIKDGNVEAAKLYYEKVWESGSTVEVKLTIDELRERSQGVSNKDKLIAENPALSGIV